MEGEATLLSFSVWKYGCRYKEVMFVAHQLLQCTNPRCVLYPLSLLAIFCSTMEQNALERMEMPLPPSGLVITQPDSLQVVKFDYINS